MIKNVKNIIAIDGLDGSGKGSCTIEIAKLMGGTNLIIDYPNHNYPWGKFLRHLLHDTDEGLSLEDRMLIYALNRLETINDIKDSISKYKEINLIFDRFYTSNIISAAYYYLKLNIKDRPKDKRHWILEKYEFMKKIDSVFLKELSIENAKVYIPMLSEHDSINSLLNDGTRGIIDSYETIDVQALAREFYLIVGKEYPQQIKIFSQYNKGRRLNPTKQAEYIIKYSGIKKSKNKNSVMYLKKTEHVDYELVKANLIKYGSEKLVKLSKSITF